MLEMFFLVAVFLYLQFYLCSTANLPPNIVSDKVKKGIKRNMRSKLRLYVTLMQNAKKYSGQERMQNLNVVFFRDLREYLLQGTVLHQCYADVLINAINENLAERTFVFLRNLPTLLLNDFRSLFSCVTLSYVHLSSQNLRALKLIK